MRPPAAFSGGGAPRRMLPTYQAATGSNSRRAVGASSPRPASRARGGRRGVAPRRQPARGPSGFVGRPPAPAEAGGAPRLSAGGKHEGPPRLLEPRGETAGADFIEHGDRRHVERKLQRTA